MEIKITVRIEAPEIVQALNNLANALKASPFVQSTQQVSAPAIPTATAPALPTIPTTTAPALPAVPTATVPVTSNTPVVPTAQAPQYTLEQIVNAGASLMDAGKINELRTLINTFNVNAVTNLKPEQYGAFATELRKLGAQI